ncbi:helix-turn-helix domain-containing protein [Bacterioplanoides sp. SCSIO 12839]|uniref:helix-turn-helix domain-containing protein n=1 Tax=Bacterioplanoides sp. SCSIO 12839 TaxID=2829569 RepID=UPI0021050EC1|nr:helix-turn-helix domain-containing protein [Bacterioplanoides sp. SCSIO 12839]UTW47856.1 helix-turn-helix domain-containing protein [Bacterioplanoides sp. SCSIO 12839]
MHSVADIQDYRTVSHSGHFSTAFHADLFDSLASILQERYQDEDSIQRILSLACENTGLQNISVAVPDSPSRFKAQFCSTGVSNGVYSFAVQHALCRQFESREWLVIKDGRERADVFVPAHSKLTTQDRCLLMPLVLRQSVLAVLVIDLRNTNGASLELSLLSFLGAQIAQMLATQVVPNFKTLYARPYQRVTGDELSDIRDAIEKCNGNKTMAAKVLGLTPRQLRYRLAKLSE